MTNTPDAKAMSLDDAKLVAGDEKITPQELAAWCDYEPMGQFKEAMPFARFNGHLKHAFISGLRAAPDPRADDGLVKRLTAMANGLRGSMWAKRDEIIALLDEAAAATRTATPEPSDAVVEAMAAFKAEMDALVRTAELSPYHNKGSRNSVAVMRDCAVRAFNHYAAALRSGSGETGEAEVVHVVFDGPPGHESGRFVECEAPDGRSINAGEWHERADGFWELRIKGTK